VPPSFTVPSPSYRIISRSAPLSLSEQSCVSPPKDLATPVQSLIIAHLTDKTNVLGVFYTAQAAAKTWVDQGYKNGELEPPTPGTFT
jgi:hypothetical protein